MEKSPLWLRLVQIILGVIAIALSGWVIVNPVATTLVYLVFLGVALIMIGFSKIIEGIVLRDHTKSTRAISIVIGVISVAGGIFAMANPIATVATIIMIVSLVIIIHGLGLIATGAAAKNLGKGTRIASIILGIIAVVVSVTIQAIPGLAIAMMLMLLSLGLLFNGIASIASGIIGHKLAATRPEQS
ncbi:MAG: HdeD family acid-resistance protein [Nitrosarchaeum sp.]